MKLQNKLLVLLLLIFNYANSQSSIEPAKPSKGIWGRNDIRIGFYFTRTSIAYDRVITDKFSVGIEGLRHFSWSTFPGYSFSILGRHYFKSFDQSGWFLEEKLSYGYYNPQNYKPLNYFGNTFSAGYRLFTSDYFKYFFVEFLAGIRTGLLSGSKNEYMTIGDEWPIGVYDLSLKQAFYDIGPGFPLYFNIRLGTKF